MNFFNDTVKNKVFHLLTDMNNLDEKMLKMIKNIRCCRKQCLEIVDTIDRFNNDICYKKLENLNE